MFPPYGNLLLRSAGRKRPSPLFSRLYALPWNVKVIFLALSLSLHLSMSMYTVSIDWNDPQGNNDQVHSSLGYYALPRKCQGIIHVFFLVRVPISMALLPLSSTISALLKRPIFSRLIVLPRKRLGKTCLCPCTSYLSFPLSLSLSLSLSLFSTGATGPSCPYPCPC